MCVYMLIAYKVSHMSSCKRSTTTNRSIKVSSMLYQESEYLSSLTI